MNWIDTTVGEYCPFIYGKGLPKTKRKVGKHPVYGSNGCVDFHSDFLINGPGIIIGRKGSVGAVHLSEVPFWPIDTSFYVTAETIGELRFTYYLLRSLGLSGMNSDSAVPGLNRDNAHNLPIKIPETKEEREALGNKISIIDQKINVNAQTNQTLEEIAQAIFKSWFVDFDPVKAKMLGEQPEGMDAATAALFPDKLVESELGLIPEGWEVKPIKDLCSKVQNGGTPKRSESSYWDGGDIPWLTSGEVRQSIITSVENRITQLGLDKSSAKWVPELSTLVALYGATAGEVSLTSVPLTTNQAVCALMPKKEHQWYNYLQLKSRVAELAGKAVGSAQQNISKGLVESTEVLGVPESLLGAFNAQVENLFKLRICNLQENIELAKLRDTQLPKLLSGEIELSE